MLKAAATVATILVTALGVWHTAAASASTSTSAQPPTVEEAAEGEVEANATTEGTTTDRAAVATTKEAAAVAAAREAGVVCYLIMRMSNEF